MRAVPIEILPVAYFRHLKIDELQSSNFSPEVKFQKPGCKAVNCFYRVALEIVVGEKFLYFFRSFLGFLAVEMTVSFSKEQMRLEVRIEQFELNFVLFSSQSNESSISATATYVENYLDCE